jgi:putative transposase
MNEVGRKHPVHQPIFEQYNTAVIMYVTVCTKNRRHVLASDAAHSVLRDAWNAADSWLVGRYVIMPDHIHFFCAPADDKAVTLEKWIAFWKSYTSRRWPNRNESPIWQRHFWDTQLRKNESYDRKWNYVVENPVRAELVAKPEDWPYQGELNVLPWL